MESCIVFIFIASPYHQYIYFILGKKSLNYLLRYLFAVSQEKAHT